MLDNLLEVPNVKDIEHVLELLRALKVFKLHPLKEFVQKYQPTFNVPSVSNNNLEQFLRLVESLEDEIQSDIYRQYEFIPNTINVITQAYFPLLDMIYKTSNLNQIPIFTTNYDRVIEEFCNHTSITCIDGFKKGANTEDFVWQPADFAKESKKAKQIVKLFKLHGSLNWRRRSDGTPVKVGAEERTRGTRRFIENVLIYPAEKVKPETEPFSSLHEWFKNVFNESRIVIFIGFAFRDRYLNEIISQGSKSKGKQLIIVSPHASRLLDNSKNQFSGNTVNLIDASFALDENVPEMIQQEILG